MIVWCFNMICFDVVHFELHVLKYLVFFLWKVYAYACLNILVCLYQSWFSIFLLLSWCVFIKTLCRWLFPSFLFDCRMKFYFTWFVFPLEQWYSTWANSPPMGRFYASRGRFCELPIWGWFQFPGRRFLQVTIYKICELISKSKLDLPLWNQFIWCTFDSMFCKMVIKHTI